jgi:transmembrane sensor
VRNDLARTIDVIRHELVPSWNEAHGERLLTRIGGVRARRRLTRVAGSCALRLGFVLAVVVGSEAAGSRLAAAQVHGAAPPPSAAAAVGEAQRLALADGSIAVLGSASARLDVLRDEPAHIELALRVGSARFEVVPNEARSFVVTADPIRVVVVGTIFEVERDDAHIRIAVREGAVRVETPSELHHVGAGGSFWLDLPAATTAQPAEPTTPEVALDPDALLEAADAARLNQQPKAAVAYLRRLLREHTTSSVAPLAGFTLGRVLLESLGQPSEAAAAFALARRQAPQGSLAQDALAREVEALSKAGRSREAYERAQSYVQQYPTGRRLRAVRLFGGLE